MAVLKKLRTNGETIAEDIFQLIFNVIDVNSI